MGFLQIAAICLTEILRFEARNFEARSRLNSKNLVDSAFRSHMLHGIEVVRGQPTNGTALFRFISDYLRKHVKFDF